MATVKTPVVSVAILTWNRSKYVLKAIDSVYKQTFTNFEIVVVDSASTDNTVEDIERNYPDVRIIRLHRNMGCPEGRNIAMANCSGDFIFCLDDDAWLQEYTLELCVARFQQEPDLGVIACQILPPGGIADANKVEHPTYQFSGGASVFRKDVLKKAGYYPSDFFRQAEEADLALRIMEAGYTILNYAPAVVYHDEAPVNRNNKLFMFYSCRNDLYIVLRRYPLTYIPATVLWKTQIWGRAGIKHKSIKYILYALLIAFIKAPYFLLQSNRISVRTIKKLLDIKSKITLSVN